MFSLLLLQDPDDDWRSVRCEPALLPGYRGLRPRYGDLGRREPGTVL